MDRDEVKRRAGKTLRQIMDQAEAKRRLRHEGILWSSNFGLSAAKSRGKIAAPTTFAKGEVGSSGGQTATTALGCAM